MTKVSRICQTMVLGIAAGIFLFLCAWRLINVMGGFEPHCTPDVLPKRRDADEKIALFTILWDVAHCDSTKRALELLQAEHGSRHAHKFIFYTEESIDMAAFSADRLLMTTVVPLRRLSPSLKPSFQWSASTLALQVPKILQYLLIEHTKAFFVDLGHTIGNGTVYEELCAINLNEITTVALPPHLQMRLERLNLVRDGGRFSLLEFTRTFFIEKVNPIADYQGGVDLKSLDDSREQAPFGKEYDLTKANTHIPRRMVLMAMVQSDEEVWMLRELVGSIHSAISVDLNISRPLICVVAGVISKTNTEMIKLWRFVEFYEAKSLLFGMGGGFSGVDLQVLDYRLALMETIIKSHGSAIWIDHRVAFGDSHGSDSGGGGGGLAKMQELLWRKKFFTGWLRVGGKTTIVVEGYEEGQFFKMHGSRVDCWRRGSSCTTVLKEPVAKDHETKRRPFDAGALFLVQSLVPQPKDTSMRSQNYCHIMIRPEVMYNPSLFASSGLSQWARSDEDRKTLQSSKKTKIAILIPSKNSEQVQIGAVHLANTFLKSFMGSIAEVEWENFLYTIYIGYDDGDPILDRRHAEIQAVFDGIVGARRQSVLFKYQLLPPAKSLTVFWNILFVSGFQDGQDYFYQVNDDLFLETAGWSTAFVRRLSEKGGFGVTGPNDVLWECSLLTQSFVSRVHYEIFQWYFPIEIKDWFSDNWISSVYELKDTFCESEYRVHNGAARTRYDICSKPRWTEAVATGRQKVALWKNRAL